METCRYCRYCMILDMVDYLDLPSMFGSLSTSVESILYCRIWLRMHFVWNRLTECRALLALNPFHDLWGQCLCHQSSGGAELIIYILPSHSSVKWAVEAVDCSWSRLLYAQLNLVFRRKLSDGDRKLLPPVTGGCRHQGRAQHAENNKNCQSSAISWIFHTLKVKKYTEVPGSENK